MTYPSTWDKSIPEMNKEKYKHEMLPNLTSVTKLTTLLVATLQYYPLPTKLVATVTG